jgi:hypothetical protein
MRSSKPAAHRRGRVPRFLFLSVLLLVSLHSEAALSASLMVKVQQLNPAGELQSVTCTDNTKCLLPISITTAQGKQDTLTVAIFFAPTSILLHFQTSKGYLYAVTKGEADSFYRTLWSPSFGQASPSVDKPSVSDVTLFLPAVPNAFLAPMLDVASESAQKVTHQAVAEVEITLQPVP